MKQAQICLGMVFVRVRCQTGFWSHMDQMSQICQMSQMGWINQMGQMCQKYLLGQVVVYVKGLILIRVDLTEI